METREVLNKLVGERISNVIINADNLVTLTTTAGIVIQLASEVDSYRDYGESAFITAELLSAPFMALAEELMILNFRYHTSKRIEETTLREMAADAMYREGFNTRQVESIVNSLLLIKIGGTIAEFAKQLEKVRKL